MPIRPATEADLPAITAIYNEVIATSTAIYMDDPVTLEDRRAWFRGRRQDERRRDEENRPYEYRLMPSGGLPDARLEPRGDARGHQRRGVRQQSARSLSQ